jgi:hypothetical protein
MRRSLAALLFLLLPATGWALAVDSTTGTAQWCQTCASKTYSFNNSSGTLLTCAAWVGASSSNFTSLTHNGTTVTPDKVQDISLGGSHTRVHHLLSPVTGPANVVLTMSLAVNAIGVSCTSFTGNDAVTPIIHTGGAFHDTSNGATGSCSVSMTAGTSGNMMVGVAQWGSPGSCTPVGCTNGETITPGAWQSGGPNNLDGSGGGDNGADASPAHSIGNRCRRWRRRRRQCLHDQPAEQHPSTQLPHPRDQLRRRRRSRRSPTT